MYKYMITVSELSNTKILDVHKAKPKIQWNNNKLILDIINIYFGSTRITKFSSGVIQAINNHPCIIFITFKNTFLSFF